MSEPLPANAPPQELFEELFVQLSTAASTCYSLCGRWRNASIIQADVAALLLKTGQLEAATAIFQYQAQVACPS